MGSVLPPDVQIIANKAEKIVNIARKHKSVSSELTEETHAIAVMAEVLRSLQRACKAIEDALNRKIEVVSEVEAELETYMNMSRWHKHAEEPAPDGAEIEIYNELTNSIHIGNSHVIADEEYWRLLNFTKKVS